MFSYFNKVRLATDIYSTVDTNITTSLFQIIMLKRQNGILKRPLNDLKNLNPYLFKRRYPVLRPLHRYARGQNSVLGKRLVNLNIEHITKNYEKYNSFKVVHVYARVKKIILENRTNYRTKILQSKLYSGKLTKHIHVYTKQKACYSFINLEYSLARVLVSSTLLNSQSNMKYLLANSTIFLNRSPAYFRNTGLLQGDLVELSISHRVYLFLKAQRELQAKQTFKLRTKLWHKARVLAFKAKSTKKKSKNQIKQSKN